MMFSRSSITTILLLLLATVAGGAEDPIQEQVISMISDIDSYVSWPASKASDNGKPLFVAVLGNSPLTARVKELNRTELPDGRKIRVRVVRDDLLPANAHIVVSSLADTDRLANLIEKLVGTSTLTINTGDADVNTILNMDIANVNGKPELRMTLDAKMAAREELTIKPKLKKLIVLADDNP